VTLDDRIMKLSGRTTVKSREHPGCFGELATADGDPQAVGSRAAEAGETAEGTRCRAAGTLRDKLRSRVSAWLQPLLDDPETLRVPLVF
jgi:hypothetical protein